MLRNMTFKNSESLPSDRNLIPELELINNNCVWVCACNLYGCVCVKLESILIDAWTVHEQWKIYNSAQSPECILT